MPLLEFLAPLLQQLVLRQQHVLNALLVALNAGLALRLRPHGLLQVLRLLERRLAPLQFRVLVRLSNAQQLREVGAPLACSVCKCVCPVHQPTTCVSGGAGQAHRQARNASRTCIVAVVQLERGRRRGPSVHRGGAVALPVLHGQRHDIIHRHAQLLQRLHEVWVLAKPPDLLGP